MEDFRGPTPAALAGARVVTTAQAEGLWKTGAIFIDLLPYVRRPANLPPGTIWREPERMNIRGSAWLPDTGYGVLSPTSEGYLRGSLDRVTDGDKHKWLVIYCRQDCWMSWNAAKRVLTMGYRNVARYPKGTQPRCRGALSRSLPAGARALPRRCCGGGGAGARHGLRRLPRQRGLAPRMRRGAP
jgi:PQQ-dependent catabolism-associated CXXCW motif protein